MIQLSLYLESKEWAPLHIHSSDLVPFHCHRRICSIWYAEILFQSRHHHKLVSLYPCLDTSCPAPPWVSGKRQHATEGKVNAWNHSTMDILPFSWHLLFLPKWRALVQLSMPWDRPPADTEPWLTFQSVVTMHAKLLPKYYVVYGEYLTVPSPSLYLAPSSHSVSSESGSFLDAATLYFLAIFSSFCA